MANESTCAARAEEHDSVSMFSPAGTEGAAGDHAGSRKKLESQWARCRFARPPSDKRPTIFVSGFGFFPTGPPPPPDPAKAKAKARWKMLGRFLRPSAGAVGKSADLAAVSVRRHSSFGLLPVLRSEPADSAAGGSQQATYEWVHYDLASLSTERMTVAVRQRQAGKVTLEDMRESFATGVDNTGNVCLWPAEEVMAHYVLSRKEQFEKKNICELGSGVGLAGLAMARVVKANSLLLTDGNAQVVKTLETALQYNKSALAGGLAASEVATRTLVWDRNLTSLEVPRAGTFDYVVAADCLFFKDFHIDLVHTIKTLLSQSGTCLLFAPLRGTTLEAFCALAQAEFDVSREERYDIDVWEAHVKACSSAGVPPSVLPETATTAAAPGSVVSSGLGDRAPPMADDKVYDPTIHYPLLITLRKKKRLVAPPSWATAGHGGSCFCCRGKKMNPAFF